MKKYKGFSKGGLAAIITVVLFIGVAAFLVIDGNNKATNYDNYDFYSIITGDVHTGNISDHVKGNPNAPTIIFEYADFQCPGCASINPRVNAAVEASNGQLAVVYRNNVLPYHQNGTAAASAAEAAGLQGYWKAYADLLFKNQAEWQYASASERTELFNQYFKEVTNNEGDLDKFNEDLASKEISQKISFDMGIAKRVGVSATPAFYFNGQYIDWSNKEGGSIETKKGLITWDSTLTGNQFEDLLLKIAEANS